MSTKSIPAFPVPLNPGQGWNEMSPCDGMTLRDYFAAKAIEGAASGDGGLPYSNYCQVIAKRAYAIADAMLAARTQ